MDIEEVAAAHPGEDHPGVDATRRSGSQPFQARATGLRPRPHAASQFKQGVGADPQPLPRSTSTRTARWPRSTRWSSPRTARVLALDAKLNFDDNALYRHKDVVDAARHQRGGPARRRGLEVRPQLHQARRQRRLHGQRRRPGHGHHGHRQARRRRAGQLPRRGRRRLARADRERLPHPLVRPEREGGPHQRVRRHPARATGSPRASSPRCSKLGLTLPVVVRLEGTNVEQGKKMLAESGLPLIMADDMGERRAEGRRRWPRGRRRHEHPRRSRTRASSCRASPARRAPSTPRAARSTAPRSSAA